MRVYKFLNRALALEALRDRRLRVARLTDLNDPFEMLPFDISTDAARFLEVTTLSALNERHGLICFSRSWTSPILWAHYADRHRGLCLGFDVPDLFLREVSYVDNRLPFPLDAVTYEMMERPQTLEQLLFTKFGTWRHEEEIRMPVRLGRAIFIGGPYFFDWNDDLKLAEVIVGLRSSTLRDELEEALAGYPGPVEFARIQASPVSPALLRAPAAH